MGEDPGTAVRWRRLAERIANAFGLVLLLVVTTYVVSSLTTYSGWSAVATSALAGTSGAVALVSAEARPLLVRCGFFAAAAAVTLAVVNAISPHNWILGAAALLQVLLLVVATGSILRSVTTELEVNFRTILGAISVYMIFGLLFSSLYAAIDRLQAGPFFTNPAHATGEFVFFSFTTLTTTGYGNLVPDGQPGQMLAGLEMLIGQIFLVTLIAGLVSLWRPQRRREARQADQATRARRPRRRCPPRPAWRRRTASRLIPPKR